MRIVIGIWLLQGLSAGSLWLALSGGDREQVMLWVGLVMALGVFGALWIWTALRDQRRLAEAQQSKIMADKTAELQANLARLRARDAAKLHALTEKVVERRPRLLKASLLTGGVLGIGLALILVQLFTLGLVVIAFVGGGMAGYALRGRWVRASLPSLGTVIRANPAVPGTARAKSVVMRST